MGPCCSSQQLALCMLDSTRYTQELKLLHIADRMELARVRACKESHLRVGPGKPFSLAIAGQLIKLGLTYIY